MWWSCWAFPNIDANLRLYCKWFQHPFEHCLRPKLIAREASLKPCHENQGSVSGCQRRAAPPLRLQGCSSFSRAGICPAPCTCLSILSLIQGFLFLLSSVLGKQYQLHATSTLFPDEEEIFLLSSNHSYSRFTVSCTLVLPEEKVNKLDNSKTQTLPDTYMHVGWLWSLLWAWIPFTFLSPKAACRWVRAAQPLPIPNPIPIPTQIVVTGLWALDVDGFSWPLLHFTACMPCTSALLCLTTRDAASCPFPPAPDLSLPAPAAQLYLTLHFQPRGAACLAAPCFLTLAFPSHIHKYIAGTSASAGIFTALCPSSCSQFSHSQHGSRGWPGRRPVGCASTAPFSWRCRGKAQGARQGGLPPKGKAEIY